MKMILNTFEKKTLFFDDDIIENKNQKNLYFFKLFFKNKIKIVIKYKLKISKN